MWPTAGVDHTDGDASAIAFARGRKARTTRVGEGRINGTERDRFHPDLIVPQQPWPGLRVWKEVTPFDRSRTVRKAQPDLAAAVAASLRAAPLGEIREGDDFDVSQRRSVRLQFDLDHDATCSGGGGARSGRSYVWQWGARRLIKHLRDDACAWMLAAKVADRLHRQADEFCAIFTNRVEHNEMR